MRSDIPPTTHPPRTPPGFLANLHERVRTIWFGAEEGPDGLLERSFRDCDDCGSDVYVLAESCRECGAELALLAG